MRETIAWTGSIAVLVLGVALATILVLERRSPWVVGAALLGALVATVVQGIAMHTDPDVWMDSYYPILHFIVFLVPLGIVTVVGAAIGGVWRLVAKVNGRRSAAP